MERFPKRSYEIQCVRNFAFPFREISLITSGLCFCGYAISFGRRQNIQFQNVYGHDMSLTSIYCHYNITSYNNNQ